VSDFRWRVVVYARSALVAAFFDDGVVRVEYVSAFPDQQPFTVWLGTATDWEAVCARCCGESPQGFGLDPSLGRWLAMTGLAAIAMT
jgi:hypothetical protein